MPKSDSGASALASLLDGSTAGELIPELARHGLQQLIELEVAAVLGADRHERTEERSGYRNGSRPRLLTTQVGDIPLLIPKLRAGSFFPTILEPRRRIDQALYAVIMEAWVQGVSTRKVDALVEAIGSQAGISRSEVSRICQGLDGQIQAFLERPLDGCRYPYLYLDATYLHGRLGKTLQVCSRAVVVAMGVNADGRRELLGLKVGDSESEPFWREFLASLKQRGLGGVRLVVSDAHVGLTKAVGRMFQGCSWQRCRVHFSRNLLQTVPKAQQEMVAAALRSVFTQQSTAAVEEQWDQVAAMLTAKFPRAADLMATAREDVLAFRHFPASHWRKLWSTNLLERVNVAPRGALGQSSSSNAAPALSASSPTTPRSHAWWARCCWSRTSTGSWRAAACSPSIPWLPFRPAPMPCLNPIRRWLPCHSPQQNVRPQPALWHAHHRAGRIAGGRGPALNPAPPPDRPGMNLLTGHC